ncbi:LOW QUALITY PROTEIN: hypothetical protein BC938DRAFT_473836 [Jimgerdemannia flammicorona]|uniref:Uncharacterized protein n=1 Tax=Jimgerdemannia flammicorona TaxID=994334 RepID=A0A433Q3D4_9FUNG|nr:LOW QUALITY PROTEIN: hypothetical protein BC938DRAFT_473836 [Jimgerdemannia flammicorona]
MYSWAVYWWSDCPTPRPDDYIQVSVIDGKFYFGSMSSRTVFFRRRAYASQAATLVPEPRYEDEPQLQLPTGHP